MTGASPRSAGIAPTLGTVVRTVGEGAWLGEYFDGKSRLPIILRSSEGATPEDLANAPLVTPARPRGAARRPGAAVDRRSGRPAIRRLNHRRTVTLTIDPPASLSLEKVLGTIDTRGAAEAARAACRRTARCGSPAAPTA